MFEEPPENLQFRPLDENPSVVEGSDVEVLCQADCIPDCEISWWRGEEEIPGTYLDGTLRLKNVRRDEIHFYTCYAFNGVGSPASKLLVLEVLCKFLSLVFSYLNEAMFTSKLSIFSNRAYLV